MKTICSEIIPTINGTSIFDVNTIYLDNDKSHLLQQYCYLPRSDTFSTYFRRRSSDNGKTWSAPEVIYEPQVDKKGTWRHVESALINDTQEGRILFFYNHALYHNKGYSHGVEANSRLFYQISDDGGKTFSDPIKLIAKGYDSMNWAPGVTYGENRAMLSFCVPIKIKNKIILPVSVSMKLNDPDYEPCYLSPACLIGEWQNGKLEWAMSSVLRVSPSLSRGLCEPAVAELKDGRLLMVMRGNNGGGYGKISDMPSYKWHAFSKDGGQSWSAADEKDSTTVKPWTYSHGEPFFSPASGSRLIRSSKNGLLYWIGNIALENPQGYLPRRPLVIGQIDEDSGCIIKKTVRTIAAKKTDDSEHIQFSNFRVYEDCESLEFVVVMPHIGACHHGGEHFDLTSPAYSHRFDPTNI